MREGPSCCLKEDRRGRKWAGGGSIQEERPVQKGLDTSVGPAFQGTENSDVAGRPRAGGKAEAESAGR